MPEPAREASALTFTVAGAAAPQGSKRVFRTGGRIVLVESSAKVKPYRAAVAAAAYAAGAVVVDGPVSVRVAFSFVRPASHFGARGLRAAARTFPGKPDTDKLVRATLDALTGIAYRDDAQVVEIWAMKAYGPTAQTVIAISPA